MHLDAYARPSSVTYAVSSGRNAAAFYGVKIACLNELGSLRSANFPWNDIGSGIGGSGGLFGLRTQPRIGVRPTRDAH